MTAKWMIWLKASVIAVAVSGCAQQHEHVVVDNRSNAGLQAIVVFGGEWMRDGPGADLRTLPSGTSWTIEAARVPAIKEMASPFAGTVVLLRDAFNTSAPWHAYFVSGDGHPIRHVRCTIEGTPPTLRATDDVSRAIKVTPVDLHGNDSLSTWVRSWTSRLSNLAGGP